MNLLDSFTVERLEELALAKGFPSLNVVRDLAKIALAAKRANPVNIVGVNERFIDEWIKCSDRMPDEFGRYWCFIEEQNCLGKSHYQWNCSWNGAQWSESDLTGQVTHWIPLPAAPKP